MLGVLLCSIRHVAITNVVYSPVRQLHISIQAGLVGHDGGFTTKEIREPEN